MAINKTYKNITITAAGLTESYSVNDGVMVYNIIPDGGAVVLAGNVSLTSTGTPQVQCTYIFRFMGGFTLGANTFSVFGTTLNAAQCLYEQKITCVYNGTTWDVSICSDFSDGNVDINGADIIAGSILNVSLYGEIALTKLLPTGTRGQVIRTGLNGAIEAANAANAGAVLGGDGTDVLQQIVAGDLTKSGANWTIANSAVTTVKILDANVTPAKLTTELKTEVLIIPCSFESGETGALTYIIPFACSVTAIRAVASKTIAGTDAATVVLKDNSGTTMTVTTPISFAASDAFGTAYSSAVTANNTFTAGQVLTVLTAKTTSGGRANLSLTVLRS